MSRYDIGNAKDILKSVETSRKKRLKTSLNIDKQIWLDFRRVVKERDLFLSDVLEEILERFVKGT
jgi:hypothetical protein